MGVFANHLIELSRLSQEALGKFGLDFSKVMLFTGGTIFNAVNSNQVLANAKPKCLIQAYGSTECGFVTTDDEEDFVPGSAGLVAPNTLLKVSNNMQDVLNLKTLLKREERIHNLVPGQGGTLSGVPILL